MPIPILDSACEKVHSTCAVALLTISVGKVPPVVLVVCVREIAVESRHAQLLAKVASAT